ncbi:hypothetical protein JOQ06_007822 [Pogonophryne albipinna]|uniref:Uncharacterized protein n=1 Tax=Pogonophryne albipinna TaxID=1090488 RepID=A0AAD6B2G8_9TELE|nr:hypothetical protein JOQ06_007822 [Pogonophryne albipinna]
MVQLHSKCMSKLDEHTPRLLKRFHSKGGSMGLKLQAILLMAPSNPRIDMSRGLVIWCLMVYLGESTDQLLKEYDDPEEDNVSQDLVAARMTIYRAKNNATKDIGIVVEGIKVLTALGTFPRACSLLIGLAYALNLAYPKEIRQTLEVFQKLFLELDCSKLSPKVNTLKNWLKGKGNVKAMLQLLRAALLEACTVV